jgi:hypothetical protein
MIKSTCKTVAADWDIHTLAMAVVGADSVDGMPSRVPLIHILVGIKIVARLLSTFQESVSFPSSRIKMASLHERVNRPHDRTHMYACLRHFLQLSMSWLKRQIFITLYLRSKHFTGTNEFWVCKKLGGAHLTFWPLKRCASRLLGSCLRKTSLWRLICDDSVSIETSVINFLRLLVNK